MKISSYKDLIVWQKSMELVTFIYDLTKKFPRTEEFGLTSQMRRSAVSIPSNIAEGRRRSSRNDYLHFLNIAYASGAELETQIEISRRLSFGQESDFSKVDILIDEVMRMLNKMTNS